MFIDGSNTLNTLPFLSIHLPLSGKKGFLILYRSFFHKAFANISYVWYFAVKIFIHALISMNISIVEQLGLSFGLYVNVEGETRIYKVEGSVD